MTKNYTKRLERLRERRTGASINESVLTKAFSDTRHGESVKYTLESMTEIDPSYTKNTYLASSSIQHNLSQGLSRKGIAVEFRHQGSVETNTHIKLHSDIDILTFTDKFITLEHPQLPSSPYTGDPNADLKELRDESFNILNSIYTQVDDSNAKSIKVYPTQPKRKVDIVICNWYNSNDYVTNGRNELYRGVKVYDKNSGSQRPDYPFLQIRRINEKDASVAGGLKKVIRLLKTLKADAEYEIKLNSFEITSAMFDISSISLIKPPHKQLLLLPEASSQLGKLINDKTYRESLRSPNGKELVFGTSASAVVELKKLKLELDELIQDLKEELHTSSKSFDNELIY